MATWTAYKTWIVGAVLPAADLNTYIRDNGGVLSYPGLAMWYTAGSAAPSGWLLCDGSAVSRATYSVLNTAYSALTYPWGNGDGSTTFNTPDLVGRTPIGLDSGSSRVTGFSTLGSTGGAGTVTLSVANLAAHGHPHSHGTSTGANWHISGSTSQVPAGAGFGLDFPSQSASDNTQTGSTTAHNNIQPSAAGIWIVKW